MMNLNREVSFRELIQDEDEAVRNVNALIDSIEFWQERATKAEDLREEFPEEVAEDIARYNRNINEDDQELKAARADLVKARRAIWNYLEARGEEN